MPWKSLRVAWEYVREQLVLRTYRGGRLIGMDSRGNRYYEQPLFTSIPCLVRNRYVEYAAGRQKDASQVPAEWHAWLHSANDDPPTQSEYQRSAAYEGHTENLSGTPARYIPYSTVRPKRTTINSTTAQIGSRLKELAQQNQQQRDK